MDRFDEIYEQLTSEKDSAARILVNKIEQQKKEIEQLKN